MGILSWLGLGTSVADAAASAKPTRISSPWTESTLSKVALADLFGKEAAPVTRAEAMRVPAVTKARALIVGPLSRTPLTQVQDGQATAAQPAWLQRTMGAVSPNMRMAYTLDDLLFYGYSLWATTRTPSLGGQPGDILDAERVPWERWRFTEDGEIEVKVPRGGWQRVTSDQVILFTSYQEGLVDLASETIRGASAITSAWVNRAKYPIPLLELSHVTDDELEEDEITALIDDALEARAGARNAVMYTPRQVEAKVHGTAVTDLFVEGRNAFTLDVARYTVLPGALLDASTATASLTYSTKEGARNELVDYSLGYWADPISGRLSQDDVTPPGTSVRFDLTDFAAPAASPIGPSTKD